MWIWRKKKILQYEIILAYLQLLSGCATTQIVDSRTLKLNSSITQPCHQHQHSHINKSRLCRIPGQLCQGRSGQTARNPSHPYSTQHPAGERCSRAPGVSQGRNSKYSTPSAACCSWDTVPGACSVPSLLALLVLHAQPWCISTVTQ